MATGEKISAQTVATTWSGSDLATIVQSGVNKSITHDVFMDDTQICKAWVNFNGTGVVAIRDDFNVSSITDNGTGDYTVNFTNALDDANYSVVSAAGPGNTTTRTIVVDSSSCTIVVLTTAPAAEDAAQVFAQVFGS